MPGKRSVLIHRLVLVFSALAVVGIVVWIGMKVLAPVEVPPAPPPKAHVTFDAKSDIRSNNLFLRLKEFIIGDIDIGLIGNPLPFVGPKQGMELAEGQESRLATMEELSLQGGIAQDLERANDGSMLILLFGLDAEGLAVYEIRSYQTNGDVSTLMSWTTELDPSYMPTRIAQDHKDRIWFGNIEGKVGYVEEGGEPVWLTGLSTGLSASVRSIVVDGVDRVWVTDGLVVTVGGDQEFEPLSLKQQLSDVDQIDFTNKLAGLPEEYKPIPLEGTDGLLKAGLLPEELFITQDGRTGLTTGYSAFHFSLALQQRPDWINTLATSTIPLVVGPSGDIWGTRYLDGALIHIWATGTREYTSKIVVPSQALDNPRLFAQQGSKVYAVDYNPESTSVLWSTEGEEWLAKIIVASGTVPLDTPRMADVDGDENVWLLMDQGGVIRIRRSRELTEASPL